MKETNPDLVLVEKALEVLREHFDTAQVFVTRHTDEGTVSGNRGFGNWFARSGQVREWIIKESEYSRDSVRKDNEDDDET